MKNFLNTENEFRFNELLFENRNKNYGAYVMRNNEANVLTKSLLIGVAIFGTLAISPLIINSFRSPTILESDSGGLIYTPVELPPDEVPVVVAPIVPPKIIENTRRHYGRPRAEIEEDIRNILAPPKQFVNKKMVERQNLTPQAGWTNSSIASGTTPKTEKVFEPAAPTKARNKDFNPKKVSPNSLENQQPTNQLKDLNKILSEGRPSGSEDDRISNASNKRRRKPRARKNPNQSDYNNN